MFDRIMEVLFNKKAPSSPKSKDLLHSRPLGEVLPVSIGTAQIVEGPYATPNKWNKVILINLLTLSRNVIQSIPSSDVFDLREGDVTEIVLTEMDILTQALPSVSPGIAVEFYLPDYRYIYSDFPMAKPREFNTKHKIFAQEMMLSVRKSLEKLITDENALLEKQGKSKLPVRIMKGWQLDKDDRPTTLLTSFPSDLLSQYKFPALNLVESHTGAVKPRRVWNTKLNIHKKEELVNMPFMKFTLQVFGDKVFFIQQNQKVKNYVVKMSQDNRWSPITTESMIRMSINKIKNQADREALMKFL